MTKRILFSLSFIISLLVISGFYTAIAAQDTTSTDPSGTYTRTSNNVAESLELKTDKKVVWTATEEGKESVVQTGTWEETSNGVVVTVSTSDENGAKTISTVFKTTETGLEVISTMPDGGAPAGAVYTKSN